MIKTAKILRYLTEQDTTSADIVRVFGLKANSACYHLSVLHKAGAIKQFGSKPGRNGNRRLKVWRAVKPFRRHDREIKPFRWHDYDKPV